ncbi:mechanosensitive ion channel family protein [Arenimonas sp.]|uniref:mechanosensitive ion channel family protein n=1 Tax=Arenimonas sp. TaxID=1872635 RepID=UPI0035AEB868
MAADTRATELAPSLERLAAEAQAWLEYLPLLAVALVVVLLAWLLGGWLSRRAIVGRIARRNPFMQDLARTTVRWLVLLAGLLIALEILDATALVGAVLGTAGVLGVALGFAFKDILENYLAGLLMSLRQPFAPRDHVVIDGNEGVIVALTSRATILMTPDGNHLRLPNALVFRGVTLNYTRNPSRRFEFDVGIGVDEDLVHAQSLGVETLRGIEGLLTEPPPRAQIIGLGDSSVKVRYFGWVDQRSHDFGTVMGEAIRRVKLALERAGLDMPEPTYRVQISNKTDAGARPAPPSAPATQTPLEPPVDTRARNDIDRQIDQEQRETAGENLLDPSAPRE